MTAENKYVKIYMVQAFRGDCFLIEYGLKNKINNTKKSNFMLIDGGYKDVYVNHLKPTLLDILPKKNKSIELVISTHIDNDHIVGLMEFFVDCVDRAKFVKIDHLWHNSWGESINVTQIHIENEIKDLIDTLDDLEENGEPTYLAVGQGAYLKQYAKQMGVNINQNFTSNKVTIDNSKVKYNFKGLDVLVIGPSQEYLEKLKKLWLKWFEDHKKCLTYLSSDKKAQKKYKKAKTSIPNHSSIMTVLEFAGKRLLFTGDGTYEQILKGLERNYTFNKKNPLKVDVFKVPHHGSIHNVDPILFQKIQAKNYLISGNNYKGNPKFKTLEMIIKSSKSHEHEEPFNIIVSNYTEGVDELVEKYPEKENGYVLKQLKCGKHYVEIKV